MCLFCSFLLLSAVSISSCSTGCLRKQYPLKWIHNIQRDTLYLPLWFGFQANLHAFEEGWFSIPLYFWCSLLSQWSKKLIHFSQKVKMSCCLAWSLFVKSDGQHKIGESTDRIAPKLAWKHFKVSKVPEAKNHHRKLKSRETRPNVYIALAVRKWMQNPSGFSYPIKWNDA